MKITVYFSPKAVKPTTTQNATVVLADVLRASSTASTYFYHGAKGVFFAPDPGTAKKHFAKLKRGEGLLAGERDWEKIPGFHLGGSPLDSSREKVKDRVLCVSTSSFVAHKPVKNAKYVILGSFLNLGDVYDSCLRGNRDVVIVTSGAKEDGVFAGMLVDFLQSTVGSNPIVATESAKEAMAFYKPWQGRLLDMLKESEEGKELIRKGFAKDLDFCARVSRVSAVGFLQEELYLKENSPKPKRPLDGDARPKSGPVAQKGKSIKVQVPLFPKNPEHPVPGMDKKKKEAAAAAAQAAEAKKKHEPKKGEAKEGAPKAKRAPRKPTAMFSKKTVATASAAPLMAKKKL
ncbi:MAG TPA: 2-phosphosulfolactate phosphatase [bacterium]|nr:2-phosphosulfolactate phosphatase [bacterium]